MDESESRWRVYRATFDTNIFLRALIQRRNLADNLLSLWLESETNRDERAEYLRQIHPF